MLLLLAGLAGLALPAAAAGSGSAVDAAEEWLDLVDRQSYGVSWELTGAGLKSSTRKETWIQTVEAARHHRGPVLSRRPVESETASNAAGLPPGEYALVTFETAFRGTGDSVESLILEREMDGAWRVVAYFVR